MNIQLKELHLINSRGGFELGASSISERGSFDANFCSLFYILNPY